MSRVPVLSIITWAPFAAALVIMAFGRTRPLLVRWSAAIAAGVSSIGAAWICAAYDKGMAGFQFGERLALVPSLGITYELGVDGISIIMVLLTAIIIFAGVFASWTVKTRGQEFYALLLLLVTGVFGVFVSLDMFVFFLFYEIAVLPMYLLIGIWGSTMEIPGRGPLGWSYARVRVGLKEYGAMKLTLYLLAGSAFILVGLFMVWVESARVLPHPTFDLLQLMQLQYADGPARTMFLLFYVGFGVLAGIWPLHTWSPDGHAAAPAAGSMMHAGVLMKLGAYGVLRVAFGLFPEAGRELAWLVGTVAVINIVYGAMAAGWQRDIKYLIAYSSVSHMGIVMLGMATLTEPGVAGAVFQMVSHGIMTALLFTLVNLVYHKTHTRDMFAMGGLAQTMPGLATFFVIAGLTSLGLPGLSGFVAEFLVFLGAWTSAHPWWLFPALGGALITAVYVLRSVKLIFLGPGQPEHAGARDAEGTEWLTLVILGALLVLLGVAPRIVLDPIQVGVAEFLTRMGV